MAGAVWGGGEGAAAFTTDAIVSFFLIGDIRDVAVEGGRLWPGGEDPDGLTVAFAAIGIFATVSGPADAAITLLKRVAKQVNRLIPNTSGAKLIAKVIRDLLSRVDDGWDAFLQWFDEWKAYFKALSENDNLVRMMAYFDETVMNRCRSLLGRFGESFAGRLTYAAAETSATAVKKAITVIDSVDEATVAIIKAKPQAAQEAILKGLAECQGRKVGNRWVEPVDDDVLTGLLNSEHIAIITDPNVGGMGSLEEFVTMVGAVARNEAGSQGTKGVNAFIKENLLKNVDDYRLNPNTGNLTRLRGSINELRQLHKIVEDPDLRLISIGFNPQVRGVKDLDAVAERVSTGKKVIYEFKSGQNSARPNKKARDKFVKQIANRIDLAKKSGHDLTGAEVRVWLDDSPVDWSPSLKQELENLGQEQGITVVLERSPL
jgi:hypothetical protein